MKQRTQLADLPASKMTQAVVKLGEMPRGGRIINIGSIASKMGPTSLGIYAAAKVATDSLMATWAMEVRRDVRFAQHQLTFAF
jgi:NAD(P)-dependent dehydrogenase (short-subunit alcohol dehydrogenase family)